MKRKEILKALAQTYEDTYREYRTLMALGTQLLNDGKHETYHEVEWYTNGKVCLLDGISLAASSLGISWDELLDNAKQKEAQV